MDELTPLIASWEYGIC